MLPPWAIPPPAQTHQHTEPHPPRSRRHSRASSPQPNPYTPSTILYQNKYGQRLDPPLTYSRDFLATLFSHKSKLCNNFYLKGHCPYGSSCSWDHSEHLDKIELDTLRHKARTSSCRDPFCRDPLCSLGHMCPRGDRCQISVCKFLPEMHNIEMGEVWEVDTSVRGEAGRRVVHRED
jgi:hypothetical protein